MAANLKEKVSAIFGSSVVEDEKLLEECVSICQIYNLDPQDLLWKWEALNFRTSNTLSEISPFTMDSIGALKETLRRNLAKEAAKKPQRINPMGQKAAINLTRTRAPVQAAKIKNMDMSSARSVQVKPEESVAGPSKVSFKGPKMDASSRKDRAYRYMYEKISERSEALDDRIDEFGELIREYYSIPELGDPSSSTDETTVVGRITHDSDTITSGAKLTDATITLESSRMYGSGSRIALRFDSALKIRGGPQGAEGLGFFPGAIAALKGKNGGGGWFLVTEILVIPPLKSSPSPSLGLSKAHTESGGFSMCIVSGPYTPDADLSYKPWRMLLNRIKTAKPAVILLIGPFVDVTHPKIKNGDIESTPTQLFRSQIIDPLRAVLDSCPGTIAAVVPSVRDIISRQAVYPQAELEPDLAGTDSRIRMLPNPARFSLNDITFAINTVDVLFHLRKDEYVKRGVEINPIPPFSPDDVGTDSMANLCRHLLQQRSFYPIFPVPLDVTHEVNLDLSHSLPGLRLGAGSESSGDDYAPDVLVLPSRFKHFSKVGSIRVHATTAINPSFLTKGTYVMLNAIGKEMVDGTKDRIQAQIMKLEI
ncbi:DNA polymerase alpha subunit B [Collybia nuda]|uniref:DNA polymerase alpha subunit B n=1 Tax=Collybia nuda TaxID=64659 RepID=A0A9P6CKV2_9AGAR|nr:DNA polymerase alpha subunit B [Collybia nuda]